MEVGPADGKGDGLAFQQALILERRRRPQRRVEGEVFRVAGSGPGLNVAAAVFLGPGARTPPAQFTAKSVERGVEPAGGEGSSGAGFLAAFPPGRVFRFGWLRRVREARAFRGGFFPVLRRQVIFFFSGRLV